jgi:hypothetical protein
LIPRILTGSDVEKIEELGHARWIGDLVLKATVPTPHSKRIQTVAEFRMRLENMGELPSS